MKWLPLPCPLPVSRALLLCRPLWDALHFIWLVLFIRPAPHWRGFRVSDLLRSRWRKIALNHQDWLLYSALRYAGALYIASQSKRAPPPSHCGYIWGTIGGITIGGITIGGHKYGCSRLEHSLKQLHVTKGSSLQFPEKLTERLWRSPLLPVGQKQWQPNSPTMGKRPFC